MNAFVVIVDFRLKVGACTTFRRLVDENALISCRDEPGCRRFDVLESNEDENRIILYEIYRDRAAFDAHLATGHFARFARETAVLVDDKHITELALAFEGSAVR